MASDLVNATITGPSSFENGDFHKITESQIGL